MIEDVHNPHPERANMSNAWMPIIELPLSSEQFPLLPRHSDYRYEYCDGKAVLSPKPKHFHAMLDFQTAEPTDARGVEPMHPSDFSELVTLFAAAFRCTQPFASLDDVTLLKAAAQALERTCSGGDGPWIEAASFVARSECRLGGAIFITLLPDTDPTEWDSYHWPEPPPLDIVGNGGRPHLTWVFVAPELAGRGIATALLRAATNALFRLGYRQLLSTFLYGNDSSLLWHWRTGFRLLAHPGSWRRRA
jgi:GNAT superfamily N-acetyltransferase